MMDGNEKLAIDKKELIVLTGLYDNTSNPKTAYFIDGVEVIVMPMADRKYQVDEINEHHDKNRRLAEELRLQEAKIKTVTDLAYEKDKELVALKEKFEALKRHDAGEVLKRTLAEGIARNLKRQLSAKKGQITKLKALLQCLGG